MMERDYLLLMLVPCCVIAIQALVPVIEAKGVAGLGKAGGDGQGGSDKAGQQVPPEVYKALTYAGSLFLLTLSVPLILYGLNKLLNMIEDCFGCGPSSKKAKLATDQLHCQHELRSPSKNQLSDLTDTDFSSNGDRQQQQQRAIPDKQSQSKRNQLQQNQRYHLQLMHQQPKCYNFTPLQESDDGQGFNPSPGAHHPFNLPAEQPSQVSPAPPLEGSKFVKPFVSASSDLETVCNPNGINQEQASSKRASPISLGLLAMSISGNQNQNQQQRHGPFMISSPHI